MTKLTTKPIRRETIHPYRHYRRTIVVSLFDDIISLRLKGTRSSHEITIESLLDTLYRRKAAASRGGRVKARRFKS